MDNVLPVLYVQLNVRKTIILFLKIVFRPSISWFRPCSPCLRHVLCRAPLMGQARSSSAQTRQDRLEDRAVARKLSTRATKGGFSVKTEYLLSASINCDTERQALVNKLTIHRKHSEHSNIHEKYQMDTLLYKQTKIV